MAANFEKRGAFSDFFSMENTDGLHKFPVSGVTGM